MNNIVKESLERGFGSMTKKDYELAVFNELVKEQFNQSTDFDLALALKIPVSKVKTLRNEMNLRYRNNTPEVLRVRCGEHLCKVEYYMQKDERISFPVSDPILSAYMQDYIERNHYVFDTSNNRNTVVLAKDAFTCLIENLTVSQANEIKKRLPAKWDKKSMKEIMDEVMPILNVVGSLGNIFNLIANFIK